MAVSALVGMGAAQDPPAAPAAAAETLLPVVVPTPVAPPRILRPAAVAPARDRDVPAAKPPAADETVEDETAEDETADYGDDDGGRSSGRATPEPRAAETSRRPAAPAPATPVEGTPCTSTARACVDLDNETAWLIDDGKVVRGPVSVAAGDRENPTPTGTFHVQWKAEEYTSREFLSQMPFSVFFADGGIAFHEGSQDRSSKGCVKLTPDDAQAWFRFLQIDDEVQVH